MSEDESNHRQARRRHRLKVVTIPIGSATFLITVGAIGYVALRPSDLTISGGLTLIDTDSTMQAFEWDEDPPRCHG